ncbi:MAG TPA: hypothetical protein VD906_07020 [Caulobacteraceae bacterium]|nr:hypothetical protein [Caulobacteraceae bacterium]
MASETEVNVRDVVMSELQRNVVSPLELRTIAREIQDFAEGLEDNDRKFFHQDDPRVVFQCVDSDERFEAWLPFPPRTGEWLEIEGRQAFITRVTHVLESQHVELQGRLVVHFRLGNQVG